MVPLAPAGHRGAGHTEPHRDQHLPHREDQGGRHEQHHCARCSLSVSSPLPLFFTLFPFPSFCFCHGRWLMLMMDVALMQVQDVGAEKDAITSLRAPTHYGRPNWDRVFSSIAEKHPETDVGVVRAPSLRACPCPASPRVRVRVRVRAPVLLRPGRAVEAAAHLLQQVLVAERHQVLLRKRCVAASERRCARGRFADPRSRSRSCPAQRISERCRAALLGTRMRRCGVWLRAGGPLCVSILCRGRQRACPGRL